MSAQRKFIIALGIGNGVAVVLLVALWMALRGIVDPRGGLIAACGLFLLVNGLITTCHVAGLFERRYDPRANLCPRCGYDRAGIANFSICPECGSPPA